MAGKGARAVTSVKNVKPVVVHCLLIRSPNLSISACEIASTSLIIYVVVPVGGNQRRGFRNSGRARVDGRVEFEKLSSTVNISQPSLWRVLAGSGHLSPDVQ